MSRRTGACLLKCVEPNEHGVDVNRTWCGGTHWRTAATPAKAGCTKCLKAYALAELENHRELSFGDPIRDEAWLRRGYRSIWPLHLDGKLIAFATLQHGWGNPWRLHRVEDDGSIGEQRGYGSHRMGVDAWHTKEQALLAVRQLVDDGWLYAAEDAAEAVKRRRAADERERIEEQAKRDAAAKAADELREAFESIATHPLTNLQRDAFATIYKRAFYKPFNK
jgi:hypothetical protein